MSELVHRSVVSWADPVDGVRRCGLFLVVASALVGFPLITVGDEAVTTFDAALVLYLLVSFLLRGFKIPRKSWWPFFALWAVYGIYLLLRFIPRATVFSGLLVAKQFEHLLFALVLVDRLDEGRSLRDLRGIALLITLVVAYQILYYHDLVFGIGTNYRLGLPFAYGVSSNPAGFFLGGWLVVLVTLRQIWRTAPVIGAASLIVTGYALVLTRSRTNLLAVLLVIVLAALVWVYRVGGWRWLLTALILVAIAYGSVVAFVPEAGPLTRVIRILKNPLSAIEDGSFAVRVQESWPRAFRIWRSDWSAVLVGRGLDYTGPVDGTVPRLLANQGGVGLALFLYVWFFYFLAHRRNTTVVLLLLFAFVNGVNAETLVVSYRSIQAYLVILLVAVSYGIESWKQTPYLNSLHTES